MPTEILRCHEQLNKQAHMAASRNAFVVRYALLLLSLYLNPMSFIILGSITVPTQSFQHPKMNVMQQQDIRQRNSGAGYMRLASPLSVPRTPRKTFLRLSAVPTPSDPRFTQQNGSTGPTRDMTSLKDWSRGCEIVLSDGVELSEDLLGDWSLTTTKSIKKGNSIMTVPATVILSSNIDGDSYEPYYTESNTKNVRDWMKSELESGSQAKQDYLPEFVLVYKLLQEVYMGTDSRWYPWLQSLPTEFSTGLYLDEVERNHAECMTGDHIKMQGLQYQACLDLFHKLVSSQKSRGINSFIPAEFLQWMLALQQNRSNGDASFEDLVKWAFSIVFTRSWRSPDRTQAQIVPLGDLANHDSQFANLKPGFRQTDGAFQFFVTNDINVVGSASPKLYLSYGLTYAPARFLVIFGFCDVTAPFIDANLDFLQPNGDGEWPTILDPSQLVASTLNGALSEEVWIAFLYKFLQKRNPELLSQIKNVFENSEERGDELVEQFLEKYELEVGMEIQSYYQRLLETDFMPIKVTEKELAEHPNLSMIVNYNLFIRETYLKILEHTNTFLAQCIEFQELTGSKSKNEILIPQFQSNPTEKLNVTSAPSTNEATSTTVESKTKEYFGKVDSSESSLKISSGMELNTSSTAYDNTNDSTSQARTASESNLFRSTLGQNLNDDKNSTEIQEKTSPFKSSENTVSSSEITLENFTSKAFESKPFSAQSVQQTCYEDLSSLNNADFKNTKFFKRPQETLKAKSKLFDSLSGQRQNDNESTEKDPDSNTTPQTSEIEETVKVDSSPNEISSPSSPYSGQQVNSFQESKEKTTNWNNTLETNTLKMSQSPYVQGEMSQVGTNLNATSRFSSENFSLQSYSSESPDDINQQATQTIPTGDFDPQYYAASQKGRTNQNVDLTSSQTSPYDNYDSQPYSDGTPFYPDGESNFFPDGDSNFFPDIDSTMQSYSDQNGQTMPIQYGDANSEMYSTSPFDYGDSNPKSYSIGEPFTQEMVNSTGNNGFLGTNNGFQPYSGSQPMPTQDRFDSNGATQYDYGSSNSQSYPNTETTQTNEINPAPAFPANLNSNSQAYPNGQGIQTTEIIESTGTNGFVNDATSINQSEGSSQQQVVGAAFVNSYAESLVSDQRGNPEQQSGADAGNELSKQTNVDIPSAPTTYAEYMQQRQEEQ